MIFSPKVGEPTPESTLLILAGASHFPDYPDLAYSPQMAKASQKVQAYFLNGEGFGLPKANFLSLFDKSDHPQDMTKTMRSWIRDRIKDAKAEGREITDVIFYYIGHGGFRENSKDYYLTIQKTDKEDPYFTSLQSTALAAALRKAVGRLRLFMVMDACFAASVLTHFQEATEQGLARATSRKFGRKGFAVLCATGSDDPACQNGHEGGTVFSDGLLESLKTGDPGRDAGLSFRDVHELTVEAIFERYGEKAVIPELITAGGAEQLDRVPFFPNPAAVEEDEAATEPSVRARDHGAVVRDAETPRGGGAAAEAEDDRHAGRAGAEEWRRRSILDSFRFHGLSRARYYAIPPEVRGCLKDYREAKVAAWIMFASVAVLSAGILYPLAGGGLVGVPPLWWSVAWYTLLTVLGCGVFAGVLSKITGTYDGLPKKTSPPAPWEEEDCVVSLRRMRVVHVFGNFMIHSWGYSLSLVVSVLVLMPLIGVDTVPPGFGRLVDWAMKWAMP